MVVRRSNGKPPVGTHTDDRNGKVICGLCGPPRSGKDTIKKILCRQYPNLFTPIPRWTTRPARPEEAEHDVHSISLPEFRRLRAERRLLAVTMTNRVYYGIHIDDLTGALDLATPHIIVTGTTTSFALEDQVDDPPVRLFYLDVPEDELRKRLAHGGFSGLDYELRLHQAFDPWKELLREENIVRNSGRHPEETARDIFQRLMTAMPSVPS